jgi:hypothetical protein
LKYPMMKPIEKRFYPIRKCKEAHPSLVRSLPNLVGIFLALLAARFGLLQALASQAHPRNKVSVPPNVSVILNPIIFMIFIAVAVVFVLFIFHQKKKREIPPLPILDKREECSK